MQGLSKEVIKQAGCPPGNASTVIMTIDNMTFVQFRTQHKLLLS